MSALRKLEQLLSRVQERRAAPRAATLAPVDLPMQGLEPPFSTPPPSTGRISKAPALTPLEESMEQVVPVERPREAPRAFEAKAPPAPAPDSDELFLDDFEPPPTIIPAASVPAARSAPVVPAQAPMPAQAPIAAPAPVTAPPVAVAAPAPITAATARIAPAAALSTASPVAVTTQARAFEPKSFGELLDLSLALRPNK